MTLGADDPEALLDVARQFARRSRFEHAASVLSAASLIAPTNAHVWVMLSDMHVRMNRTSAAIACLHRVLDILPGHPEMTRRLCDLLINAGRPDEAAGIAVIALTDHPAEVELRMTAANALAQANRHEEALPHLEYAAAARPDRHEPRLFQALLRLESGDLAKAWPDFVARFDGHPEQAPSAEVPIWDGGDFAGRTLMITAEGGHGDNIWGLRFLPDVKARGGTVIYRTGKSLEALVNGVAGIDRISTTGDAPPADLCCPILSLPQCLGVTKADQYPPADFAPPALDPALDALLSRAGERLKVGLIWSGSETYGANHLRAARLEDLLPLTEVSGVQFYSLQKGRPQAQLRDSGYADIVIETSDLDFAQTAALVARLDLVIMTDSAVAHLAGSLGTPVWVLLHRRPYWYFGRQGGDCPWYPSMRLFRQDSPGGWAPVVEKVRKALLDRTNA